MQNLQRLHNHRPTFTEREATRDKRIAGVQALIEQSIGYRGPRARWARATTPSLLGKC